MYVTGKYRKASRMLGKHGEYAPEVCAISGEALRPEAIKHNLTGGFYCKVNPIHDWQWSEELAVNIRATLPKSPTKKIAHKGDE
jgi:hypothetical protein